MATFADPGDLRCLSDADLISLAAEGHALAFAELVARHDATMRRACRRIVPADGVEDVMQETWLASWHALQAGVDVQAPAAWLHRIARNAATTSLRRSPRPAAQLDDFDVPDESTERLAERRDEARRTLAGVARLPERHREALVSTVFEGEDHATVAHRMDMTPGALRQLLLRTRAQLRAAVGALIPAPLVALFGRSGEAGAQVTVAGTGGAGLAAVCAKGGAALLAAGSVAVGSAAVTGGQPDSPRRTTPDAPAAARYASAAPPSLTTDERAAAARGDAARGPLLAARATRTRRRDGQSARPVTADGLESLRPAAGDAPPPAQLQTPTRAGGRAEPASSAEAPSPGTTRGREPGDPADDELSHSDGDRAEDPDEPERGENARDGVVQGAEKPEEDDGEDERRDARPADEPADEEPESSASDDGDSDDADPGPGRSSEIE